ncbi:MAG TPA: TMEM175 family protein [Thermoanaerobaculia bacterium]
MPPPAFRNRSREVSRIEAFSDVVFGFALTLIVVSLEVPQNFAQLMTEMRGFAGFAICFGILMWVWYVHHTFFRRYGLSDDITLVLNTLLMFLVLFYVYPLKFTFAVVTGALPRGALASRAESSQLMLIYGLGFTSIFLIFFFMHLHAYRKRAELELTDVEVYDTRTQMIHHVGYMAIGVVSTILAATFRNQPQWAGWIFFLIGPTAGTIGWWRGTRRDQLSAIASTS